jgi:hypothetical protein
LISQFLSNFLSTSKNNMVDNSEKSMQGLPLMKGRGCIAY